MSLLGFDKAIQDYDVFEKRALTGMMRVALVEFKENFATESAAGKPWDALSQKRINIRAWKGYPAAPILQETGKLLGAIKMGNVVILSKSATLTVDPIDDRGNGYAEYHEIPTPANSQGEQNKVREFLTQSTDLTEKQIEVIYNEFDKIMV